MYYSIDRFEGEWAVLIDDESGEAVQILRIELPAEAEEGGICRLENGMYFYDAEETARRRLAFFERTRRLAGE